MIYVIIDPQRSLPRRGAALNSGCCGDVANRRQSDAEPGALFANVAREVVSQTSQERRPGCARQSGTGRLGLDSQQVALQGRTEELPRSAAPRRMKP